MNILASYNWIKEHVQLKENAEQFARRISLSGPAVERAYPQAEKYSKMVIGKIVEVKPHPNADKLRIVATDVGGEKPLEIVCGGSNVAVDMKVVVALVGSKVKWHGQGDLVELVPATIRGVASDGMICGANEVGLEDAFPHAEKEIMDVSWCTARPGTSLAKAFELDDTVFDIEVTTNRPDAFCMVGMAREASAIFNTKFLWKEPVLPSLYKGAKVVPLEVKVSAPKVCTRYQAVVMDDVTVGPSPWWLKKRLLMAGLRPINTVVDITNYVMLEYGQPMHAFDHAMLAGGVITVRNAKEGEKIVLLDGVEKTLSAGQVVIADAKRPLAVAGVMGGKESGVTEATKTIVFEAATFEPVSVRRTARALNVHTDSSLRFEKGLPEELTQAALARAVELCQEIACGRVASKAVDVRSVESKKEKHAFRPARAAELIGVALPEKDMVGTLKRLGFVVSKGAKGKYDVTVPYWRERDIEGERDLVEEVARVYGYVNLPSEMPTGALPETEPDALLDAEDRAKLFCQGAGYTELLSYSIVPRAHFEKCGWDAEAAVRVSNPLSADFEFMRTSLVPGMLQTVQENQGMFPSARLFEVSQTYHKTQGGLPSEKSRFAAAVYGPETDDRAFLAVKGLLEAYADEQAVRLTFARREDSTLLHPGRGVEVFAEGESVGFLGEVHPSVRSAFGIDGRFAFFEVDLKDLLARRVEGKRYQPAPLYPSMKRDLAAIFQEYAEYGDVADAARAVSTLLESIELFDVYRGKGVPEGKKSIGVRMTFSAPDRTLTTEEVDAEIASITTTLGEKFGAIVRT